MATWKKVLVSGSAAEVANLTATGNSITFSGLTGLAADSVLAIDAAGAVTAVASDSVGGGGNLILSGSDDVGKILTLSSEHLHFDSTNGVTILIEDDGGSGTEPQITISTPQDLQTTATPTFQSLAIQDDGGTPTITIKDPSDSTKNGNITFTSEGDLVFTAGTNTKLAFYGQTNVNDRYIHVNPGEGASDRRDINFIASGKVDKHLFVVDASASFSSSAGEVAGRGKVGVGLGDDGFTLLNDVDNEVTKDAVLVVSGNVAVVGGNITASSFTGDGSGLTGITADTATTLTGFDVTEYNNFTAGIDTFTGSIQTQVNANTALTASTLRLENDQTVVKQYSIPVFHNTTPNTVSTGSDTFRVTYNPTHFPSGRSGATPVNDLNNGSGSYYLYVQSASIGDDLYVGGDIDLIGTINNVVGFNFTEGNITVVSGAVHFGSGSAPGDIDLVGGHQFTGSLKISGGLYVDRLIESNQNKIVVYNSTTGQFFYTSSVGGDAVQGGTIGNAGDNDYTDGFFDYFTPSTTIGTAIDDISEAFALLAPPQAGKLDDSATNLTVSGFGAANLSAGLTALGSEWYTFGASAGSSVNFKNATAFDVAVETNASNLLHVGTSTGYLTDGGGFTASIDSYVGSETVKRNYSQGNGTTTGTNLDIEITNNQNYTTNQPVWQAQQLTLAAKSLLQGGGVRINVTGSGAQGGAISDNLLVWTATGGDYPAIANVAGTVDVSGLSTIQLSGQTYYSAGNVDIDISADNAYYPVYKANNATLASSYVSGLGSVSTFTGTPNYNDSISNYAAASSKALTGKTAAGSTSPGTVTVTVSKPGGDSDNATVNIGTNPIRVTYSADTMGNTNNLYFQDEVYRRGALTDITTGVSTWSSGDSMNSSNLLKVANGQLGHASIYGHTSVSNVSHYYREITPTSANRFSGTFSALNLGGGAFDGKIGAFGSTLSTNNGIQIAIVFQDSVNVSSQYRIFDLGRAYGNNSIGTTLNTDYGLSTSTVDIIGAMNGYNGNLSALTNNNFTFDGGSASSIVSSTTTGTGRVYLWIVMRYDGLTTGNLQTHDVINSLTLTYN